MTRSFWLFHLLKTNFFKLLEVKNLLNSNIFHVKPLWILMEKNYRIIFSLVYFFYLHTDLYNCWIYDCVAFEVMYMELFWSKRPHCESLFCELSDLIFLGRCSASKILFRDFDHKLRNAKFRIFEQNFEV